MERKEISRDKNNIKMAKPGNDLTKLLEYEKEYK